MCTEVRVYTDPQNTNDDENYGPKMIRYPFQDVGPLKMHVPYHFVIVNSGEKLERLFPAPGDIDFETYFPWADRSLKSRILTVLRLYRIWMRCRPGIAPRSKPSRQGSVLEDGVRRSALHASQASQASPSAGRPDAGLDENLGNILPPMDEGESWIDEGLDVDETLGSTWVIKDEYAWHRQLDGDNKARIMEWVGGLTLEHVPEPTASIELPAADPGATLVEEHMIISSLDKGG